MPTPHIYLAPMEGVTTFLYRRAHAAVYGPLDKYFTPFLEPREKRSMKTKERNEVLPEHNKSLNVVPQILTNHAAGFLELAGTLWEMGYREINLNLGCPSKTVVTRGKGSGFLAAPEELDRFFDAVYKGLPGEMKLSVKTRIGVEADEEFERLLAIYNQYPISELIIHPRLQQDYYKNHPRKAGVPVRAGREQSAFMLQRRLIYGRADPGVRGRISEGRSPDAGSRHYPESGAALCAAGRGGLPG